MSSITIIKPKTNPFDVNWKEIWESKDLFYFLTWRDIKIRYKQTLLGIFWIILQPFVSMIVFTIIFGNLASIPSDNIPYPIFVFLGLLFWQFFSATINSTANSLISNENIIKKVYFPKIMAPISSTFAHIIDLVPTLLIFIGLLAYYKIMPDIKVVFFFPILLLMVLIISLGVGMFLAPINAKFRDVRYILPFFIQLGFFATPVIYPSTMFGGSSPIIRILNPIAEVIEVSRSLFFNVRTVDWKIFGLSFLFSLFFLIIGFYYFRSQEDKFVDIL